MISTHEVVSFLDKSSEIDDCIQKIIPVAGIVFKGKTALIDRHS